MVFAGRYFYRRFRLPGVVEAERRLEKDNRLDHRPLTALRDTPIGGGADAAQLWRAHRARVWSQIGRVRVAPPRSPLAKLDIYALRNLALVLLLVGVAVGFPDYGARLGDAVRPAFAQKAAVPPSLDVWIEPPEYTGVAPVFAQPETVELSFPAGSRVIARVNAERADESPVLTVDTDRTAFEQTGEGVFEASRSIASGDRLAVSLEGDELGGWALIVVPDTAPEVSMPRAPQPTQRSALRIDYLANDDYGVEKMSIRLERVDGNAQPVEGQEPFSIDVPVSTNGQARVQGTIFRDLTPHRWAGEKVALSLSATDAIGQTGTSKSVLLTLPEKLFTHPVARAIVEERKKLDGSGENLDEVRGGLRGIASAIHLYDGDFVVFLALASARSRLVRDPTADGVESVRDLLWETALALEDGDISLAERELRAA
ncbi:MAG: DUF4175 domain-containing protein, partial [Pirellulales bacterium]|nr:DUF4175 domain-containing protein [Pirellulales bacterium]